MPTCRPLYINPQAQSWNAPASASDMLIDDFHRKLLGYSYTPLVHLEEASKELGVRAVYLKDESSRFGLPSFKILGASWGVFRVIARRYSLELDPDIDIVRAAVRSRPFVLYAATDGNHGRAVARMGKLLGIETNIYVPRGMDRTTAQLIRDEGANVMQLDASYDEAVSMAHGDAVRDGGALHFI